jgi:methionyl-tRNA formyltransferase
VARVVFMGTPDFAVPTLRALAKFHSVVGVYTQPDKPVGRGLDLKASPVKVQALELGIPVFQPLKLSAEGEFGKLGGLKPDFIVVVAYGQILKKNVIELPTWGCINIHSSLLPRWRGAAPIQWSILSGDKKTGVTTMHMVEKLDAGDILLQMETPILETDTAETVHDRLAQMGAEMILPTLQGLEAGTLKGKPQEEALVTYASKLTKEMERLDPEDTAENLGRRIRALNPWPGTSLDVGQRLKILQARVRRDIQGVQGQIFEKFGTLLLGTAQGSLELLSLQWEGKKKVSAAEFMNGLQGRTLTVRTSSPIEPDRAR